MRTRTWIAGSGPSAANASTGILIVGRRQLEQVLRVNLTHYNSERPHRALGRRPPDPAICPPNTAAAMPYSLQVARRDLLGDPIHEYELAAA